MRPTRWTKLDPRGYQSVSQQINKLIYTFHLEITGAVRNLIGSQQSDSFTKRVGFCSKLYLFPSP